MNKLLTVPDFHQLLKSHGINRSISSLYTDIGRGKLAPFEPSNAEEKRKYGDKTYIPENELRNYQK